MTRLEIAGYVQIVIGIVGIVLTLLTAPSILDAFWQVAAGKGVPPEFNTVSGAIRVFAVMVLLCLLLLLVVLGASISLSTLFKVAGANNPLFSATCLVIGVFGMAASATFGVFRNPLWVPAFVGSLGALLVSATSATDDPEGEASGMIFTIFFVLFFLTGLFAIGSMNAADREARNANIIANWGQ